MLNQPQNTPDVNSSFSLAQISAQLRNVHEAHITAIVSHDDGFYKIFEKELGSNSPIFDTFFDDVGSIAIKLM